MTEQTEQQTPPSAAHFDLNESQLRVAGIIHGILSATDENGEPRYEPLEVRDFMVACMFELGLPMSRELHVVLGRFLEEEIAIDSPQPTPEELMTAVRAYFDANPLNPDLAKAFQQLGTEEMFRDREGFKGTSAGETAARTSAGFSSNRRAPMARGLSTGKPVLRGKVKRGLA